MVLVGTWHLSGPNQNSAEPGILTILFSRTLELVTVSYRCVGLSRGLLLAIRMCDHSLAGRQLSMSYDQVEPPSAGVDQPQQQ